jgi:uncharacterized repeat protein (TIGR01451 family)
MAKLRTLPNGQRYFYLLLLLCLLVYPLQFGLHLQSSGLSIRQPIHAYTAAEASLASPGIENIGRDIEKAAYQFNWDERAMAYAAPNNTQRFSVQMLPESAQVTPLNGNAWSWNLQLTAWGYGEQLQPAGTPQHPVLNQVSFDRIEYLYPGTSRGGPPIVADWYQNSSAGLELGLTAKQAPQKQSSGTNNSLVFEYTYAGSLVPSIQEAGQTVIFSQSPGTQLRFGGLVTQDARGAHLPTWFSLAAGPGPGQYRLRIHVDDRGAVYPLEVDPLLTQESAILHASDGAAGDFFGFAVAVSDDIALVGAPSEYMTSTINTNDEAYIYYRNLGGADAWGEVAILSPSDGDTNQQFGYSVAVSGDIAAVGAPRYDVGATINRGAVYIYQRNLSGQDSWGQVIRLLSPDGKGGDQFGRSVALEGDLLVVGSPYFDESTENSVGKVYIFGRNQGGIDQWGLVKTLTPGDSQAGDRFGFRVDISGDTVVASAPYKPDQPPGAPQVHQGAAYIFSRNTGGADQWGQVHKLLADDGSSEDYFGWSVAIDGDKAVVGAIGYKSWQGAAYVYSRNQGGADQWGQSARLVANDCKSGDHFAWSVDINGDIIAAGSVQDNSQGNFFQGSVYLFNRNLYSGDSWSQEVKISASDGTLGDNFGQSVAINDSALLVGAPSADVSGRQDQGSAYAFYRSGASWVEIASPVASDGAAGDEFGWSIDINRDYLVVGAPGDDGAAGANQGAAYVFSRNQAGSADSWGQVRKLTASDAAAGDQFGSAVSIADDQIIVGAPQAAISGHAAQGAAYIFSRNAGGSPDNWGQVRILAASDGAANAHFGSAVSLVQGQAAVGAPGAAAGAGAVYLFYRNQGNINHWGELLKLSAGDGLGFGSSLAITNAELLVGAPNSVVSGHTAQGAAYLFYRNQGGADTWGQVRRLTASDGAASDHFGSAVALTAITASAGAPGDNSGQGSAYLFSRNQGGADNWGQIQKRTAQDPLAAGAFGTSLDINEDVLVVGAPGQEAVYTFRRNQTGANTWSQFIKLAPYAVGSGVQYGQAVALDSNFIAVGAPHAGTADQGTGYIYQLTEFFEDLSITKSASASLFGPGSDVTFVLSFENSGDRLATGIVITDTLPGVLVNPSFTSSGVVVTETSPGYVWQAADMDPGESGVITVTATIDPQAASGVFTNTVEISGISPEINLDNNRSSINFTIDATPPAIPVLVSPVDGYTTTNRQVTMVWSASTSTDVAGYLLNFNGQTFDLGNQTSYQVGNLTQGSYTWKVAAYDGFGNTSAFSAARHFTVNTTAQNQKPVAVAGPDRISNPGEPVTLDGSNSYDPDDHYPLSYTWTQTGGQSVSFDPTQEVLVFNAPHSPGVLTFSLVVRDFLGLASSPDTVTVTVVNYTIYLPVMLK